MGVRYRYLLSLIVYLLVFNSISTVILHNEIVIETSSSSSSSPTETSSQSSSQTSNEAADLKKTGDDPDPVVEKLVEVLAAAADVVNDAQSQSQSNEPTPPNSPPSQSQTTTSESGTPGEAVESSAQISPPTDQTNQTAEANSTTTNKSSQAEMVRAAAGVVVVNKAGGEEMQSFEEWKEMRLKSSSSAQDKSTTSTSSSSSSADPNSAGSAESATSGSGLPITSSSTQTASQSAHEDSPHQRRKNYASAECGAKIIASNPESNKPSNILSENKDDYMLNSCSNRVWFVVELCEPIRVIELELANFELFSNVPKQFRVYASERYVASSASSPNWPQKYLVGTFEAANVRTVQKFAIKDAIKETTSTTSTNQVDVNQSQQPNSSSPSSEQPNSNSHLLHNQNILMYAKYVRFEMLSHYGSEHYCPLSLVRIFGTSISDDEEAAAAAVSSSETDEVESRSIHVESSSSSSTTQATTTTTKNDKDEEKVNFLNLRLVKERVNLFAKSSQFLSNIIATFLAENFNLSKLFTVFSSNTDKNAANSASTTFSPPSTDSTSTTQQPDTSSSTKLTTLPPFDRRNQMLQIDLHKVLCFSSMRNTFDCCQCLPEDDEKSSTTATFMIRPYQSTTTTTTNNWMSKYCGYYFLMITSAQAQLNTSLLFKFLNNIKYSNGEAPLQLHPSNFTRFSLNNVNYYILNEWLDNQTAAHFYFKKSPSSETNPTPQSEEHSTLNLNMFASSLDGRNITSPPIIEPNEVNETNENSNYNSTTEVKPTPTTIDETPSIESTPQQQQSQEEPVVDVNEGSKNVETSTSSPPPPPPENQDTTSTSTSTSTNNNNAQIPTVVTPVIIGNGKDAVLMRLSNRVKILELNMTLSSQYLEKLSQHYKKQMDEMQRAFNVTTSALLETIRIADERDLKQNERIVTIERRVEKMQNSMEALENLLNDLKFQTDILIWTIIIILNIIILIEVVRWLRNAFSSSSPSPSGKPSKTLNRSISSQQSSARIHLSASEIEALIEERVRRATESLREELIEQQRQKQFTTTTTMTEPPSTPQRVETLTSTTTTTLESAMAQPQAAAAAAAVVSSTLATVVAIAAAATAQCSTLGAQHHGEEKS